tara:strand:+ start:730 stop:1299 length:570 start_codon:yes stop_codon:yes gene_type:complete
MSNTPFPKGHILNDIWGSLTILVNELSSPFPIPPRTALMITEKRKVSHAHAMLIDDSLVNHMGWASVNQTSIVDSMVMLSLWTELSEIHSVPAGFFSSVAYDIRTDPSFMDVSVTGLEPFLLDKNGHPTIDLDRAVNSTPSLMRVVWDGALSGDYWDVEKIMLLPKTVNYSPELVLEHSERVGIEVEFA